MTHADDWKDFDKPRKKRKQKVKKHSVLWTIYHTILAVELLIIIIIEGLELYYEWFQ
jgi:cytochrome b subunit of formate dehydrogenase|tara:strand:+ start:456 stop:626 length:171 start_codon:yes stop_codon:yes gene_type:complete